MGKKSKENKGGGLGKLLLVLVVLVAVAAGAAWFLAPDLVREQLDKMSTMLG